MANTETRRRQVDGRRQDGGDHDTSVVCVVLVFVALVLPSWLGSPRAQQARPAEATQAQQRPVFRGGTHFVRVDAYPLKDGRIVEGLAKDDFEILEDGNAQQIDSFDFVKFETFTPEAERRDPLTQREGFDMAADPRNRVFVVFVDMAFSGNSGAFVSTPSISYIQRPLTNFLDRILGPLDLYGFLTSRNSAKDLVLQRKTTVTREQIADLWRSSLIDKDEADELVACAGAGVGMRKRADATYSTLEALVAQLESIRQERKSVILVTDVMPRWRPDRSILEARGPRLPRVGFGGGRVGTSDRNQPVPDESFCASETQRLAFMDFDERYKQLLRDARNANVAFYPITPGGLQAPVSAAGIRAAQNATDDLRTLASETDGIAVVNTNDLDAGIKRIADDMAAYYVLGYYTTNTNFDGALRNIKVRYKADGGAIRARRQYRAPTQQEIGALATSAAKAAGATGPSPLEAALTRLERAARPFAIYPAMSAAHVTVVTELSAAAIQSGRWKGGASVAVEIAGADGTPLGRITGRIEPGMYAAVLRVPITAGAAPARVTVRINEPGEAPAEDWAKLLPASTSLFDDPTAYRSASRIATRPVATFEFARNERIRVAWPIRAALDRREVRLLDRSGKPLRVELPLSEDTDKKQLVVDMSLSGLGRGDYVIELTAGAAQVTDRGLLAIRVK